MGRILVSMIMICASFNVYADARAGQSEYYLAATPTTVQLLECTPQLANGQISNPCRTLRELSKGQFDYLTATMKSDRRKDLAKKTGTFGSGFAAAGLTAFLFCPAVIGNFTTTGVAAGGAAGNGGAMLLGGAGGAFIGIIICGASVLTAGVSTVAIAQAFLPLKDIQAGTLEIQADRQNRQVNELVKLRDPTTNFESAQYIQYFTTLPEVPISR